MDFDLSADQRLMQQTARGFLEKAVPISRVRELHATGRGYDDALWRDVAEQGWLAIVVSEADGGLGLGTVELAAVMEEAGRANLPGPLWSAVWSLATLAACPAGTMRERLLQSGASGTGRCTVAWAEEEGEWCPRGGRLTAERAGDRWHLEGRKELVLDVDGADSLLVTARERDETVLLALPIAEVAGAHATSCYDRSRRFSRLEFGRSTAVRAELLARGAEAVNALRRGAEVATVGLCAEMVGAMQWALQTAVAYVTTRQQFGKAVGSFQAVQHQCADMYLWLESSRSATYYAAWAIAAGDPVASEAVALAKAYCSDAARETLHRAIQTHGGIGFTWEHDLQLYYKRVKTCEMLLGDATRQQQALADLLWGAV